MLDLIMPDQEGATVAAQLEADWMAKNVPILFLTAVLSKHETALCSGIVARHPVLSKPIGLDELTQEIERLMDRQG